jgi:hypothetical protein
MVSPKMTTFTEGAGCVGIFEATRASGSGGPAVRHKLPPSRRESDITGQPRIAGEAPSAMSDGLLSC